MPTERVCEPQSHWLRTSAAASYVKLSPSTLEKLRLSGDGPPFSKAGKRIVLYLVSDLDDWLKSKCHVENSGARVAR